MKVKANIKRVLKAERSLPRKKLRKLVRQQIETNDMNDKDFKDAFKHALLKLDCAMITDDCVTFIPKSKRGACANSGAFFETGQKKGDGGGDEDDGAARAPCEIDAPIVWYRGRLCP